MLMKAQKISLKTLNLDTMVIGFCSILDGLGIEFKTLIININLKLKFHRVSMGLMASFLDREVRYATFRSEVLDTDLKFLLAAIYDGVGALIGATVNLSLDCLPVIFMSYIVALLRELSRRLEKIGTEKEENIDLSSKQIPKKTSSKDMEKHHLKELIVCVGMHLKIKKITTDMEKIFSITILVQGLMSSVIFCMTVYLLSKVSCFSF
jgi:hypothetical protein